MARNHLGILYLPLVIWCLTVPLKAAPHFLVPTGYIEPTRVFLQKGHMAIITCTLNGTDTRDYSSANMTFKISRNSELKLDQYMHILNERSIRMILPGWAVLPKYFHQKMLECFAGDMRVAQKYVVVGYPPHKIKGLNATLRNWETFRVQWHHRYNKGYTNYCNVTVNTSTIQNKRLNCSEYRDKDTVYYHANWPLSPREVEEAKYFVVSIIIKNIIGSTPVKEVFYPESIVQPSPIENGKMGTITSKGLSISWNPAAPSRHLTYSIVYDCGSGPKELSYAPTPAPWQIYQIQGLRPNKHCTIRVACRSGEQPSSEEITFPRWSEAVEFDTTTKSDVPGALPLTSPNGYTIKERTQKNRRDVTIYWNAVPLDQQNSEEKFMYVVRQKKGNRENNEVLIKKVAHDTCYVDMNLNNELRYIITVVGENDHGENKSLDSLAVPIVIPKESEAVPPPQNVTAFQNGTNVAIHWNMVEGAQYTVFVASPNWNDTIWIENVTSPFIRGNPGVDAAAYKYGVAATKNGITSGLTWSNCLYDISAVVKVDNITPKPTVGGIILTLDPPGCTPGFVYGYLIKYRHSDENEAEHEEFVASNKREYTLSGLQEKTSYELNIYALTAATQLSPCSKSTPVPKTFQITTEALAAGLTTSSILAMSISLGFLLLLCAFCGLICCCRSTHNKCRQIWEKLKIQIVRPSPVQSNINHVTSLEDVSEMSQVTQTTPVREGTRHESVASAGADSGLNTLSYRNSDDYYTLPGTKPLLTPEENKHSNFPLRPVALPITPDVDEGAMRQSSFQTDPPDTQPESDSLSYPSDGEESNTSIGYTDTKVLPPAAGGDSMRLHVLTNPVGSRMAGDGGSSPPSSSSSQQPFLDDNSEGYRADVILLDDPSLVGKPLQGNPMARAADIWSPQVMALNMGTSVGDPGTRAEPEDVESDSDSGYNKTRPFLKL